MSVRSSLQSLMENLNGSDRMPLVFLGHGSPMHAIRETTYSRTWAKLGEMLPRPQAILAISAHWMTRESTLVDISAKPRTIHDFRGFPPELHAQQYPAPGAPDLACDVINMLSDHHAQGDDSWGLDHGTWCVLNWLYPNADVPTFQLSIDMSKPLDWHLSIGKSLADLRDRGVLILGSGNIVHNLPAMNGNGPVYDWAEEFDTLVASGLEERDFDALTDRRALGTLLDKAHPTIDHYIPALSVTGASSEKDTLHFMNDTIDMGSISMRSFVFC